MNSNSMQLAIMSGVLGFGAGVVSSLAIIKRRQRSSELQPTEKVVTIVQPVEMLHWNPLDERRGLGDLIHKVNHVAIIVSNVGRSLSFYVDILGFQQIRRPNFDRHGAWLTMGNIELHLIKGIPVTASGDDLIVGHIALETMRIEEVLAKLTELNVDFRQNISVPDAKKSRENRFEGPEATKSTGVIQYFFTDPDGYYIELCNCDILTDFCLNRGQPQETILYNEGIKSCRAIDVAQLALRWKRKTKRICQQNLDEILDKTPRATEVNEERFNNLCRRRFTYGDRMQAYTAEEIKEALLQTFNFVPLAIKYLLFKTPREQVFQPPSFYEHGELTKPKAFQMKKKESKH